MRSVARLKLSSSHSELITSPNALGFLNLVSYLTIFVLINIHFCHSCVILGTKL